ncbi:hypothetical protein HYPSUDRAFT_126179 [Hypholoma sublateritium FD-334 SS-4]|uniref:Photolyase/cryptochrome alpha/beta domain-containing protein n=1 Tax=Hypholoma sublateritium (strain FD-334 SS-4) TaxID=945553 RepID=A0A0D2LPV1_HYPSF|nr:hypothetical protein HYPSUDRAFT_126179 [Hypholoma sublateritium FD-334 SS-4]
MSKRELPPEAPNGPHKRSRLSKAFSPIKIATKEAAAVVDTNTPLSQLTELMFRNTKKSVIGKCVVFWMRMSDLRITDNKALSRASKQAQQDGIPLLALFIISPQDFVAHDIGARKIDFVFRNLHSLKKSLSELHIPLYVAVQKRRKDIPTSIIDFCEKYEARNLFANIEYEVDELRRDIETLKLGLSKGYRANFEHDKCIVEPGKLVTKQGHAYAVYSPYQRNWLATVNSNISYHLEDCANPTGNSSSIRTSDVFSPLFDTSIPAADVGLQEDDANKMKEVWPEGEEAAAKILQRFLNTKSRTSQLGAVNPVSSGSEDSPNNNRVAEYGKERDRIDSDTTSRLSAYLTSGVISIRACVRATMLAEAKKIEGDKTSGIGRWLQELAWRDFYTNILAAFPRVSMGRPYLEKFSAVVWENHQVPQESGWKVGMTGVPIVDATMRCINEMGWVHNRARMITAMYLTKDLMIDWRVGERYFMEKLIDGDLSSNNGGWQWCASTGVDPCPYFRIFNPYTQSLKADPTGNFIRNWIPELRKLHGTDLHNPPATLADELGYPRPIIDHHVARERALRRYKNPGEE